LIWPFWPEENVPSALTGPVTSVAWSGDNKTLASGSLDATVRLWDVGPAK
jgi:WD40 repeat protein